MATSTVANGNDILVYVEGVAIGCLTSNDWTSTNDEIDVTCKDNSGARQVLPGGNSSSINFEGFFNPVSTYGFRDLMGVHTNKTRVWIKMQYTTAVITGFAYLNTLNWSAPVNAGSTFSGTFTFDGGYTIAIT